MTSTLVEQLNRRADDHDGDVDLRLYYGISDAKLDRAVATELTTLLQRCEKAEAERDMWKKSSEAWKESSQKMHRRAQRAAGGAK